MSIASPSDVHRFDGDVMDIRWRYDGDETEAIRRMGVVPSVVERNLNVSMSIKLYGVDLLYSSKGAIFAHIL